MSSIKICKTVRTGIIIKQNNTRFVPYGDNYSARTVLYRMESFLPYGLYFTVPTLLYRMGIIVTYGHYCNVPTILYFTLHIVPNRKYYANIVCGQYCIVRTKFYLPDSIVLYGYNRSVLTIWFSNESFAPFGQYYTVRKVFYCSDTIEPYGQYNTVRTTLYNEKGTDNCHGNVKGNNDA